MAASGEKQCRGYYLPTTKTRQELEQEVQSVSTHQAQRCLTNRKEWRRGCRALAGRSPTAAVAEAMATQAGAVFVFRSVRSRLGYSLLEVQLGFCLKLRVDGPMTSLPHGRGREHETRLVCMACVLVFFLSTEFFCRRSLSAGLSCPVDFQATHHTQTLFFPPSTVWRALCTIVNREDEPSAAGK